MAFGARSLKLVGLSLRDICKSCFVLWDQLCRRRLFFYSFTGDFWRLEAYHPFVTCAYYCLSFSLDAFCLSLSTENLMSSTFTSVNRPGQAVVLPSHLSNTGWLRPSHLSLSSIWNYSSLLSSERAWLQDELQGDVAWLRSNPIHGTES